MGEPDKQLGAPQHTGPRGWARQQMFDVLQRIADTDDGRLLAHDLHQSLAPPPDDLDPSRAQPVQNFYPELPTAPEERPAALRDDVIFITGRFRSGSTMLWNLFRQIRGCTAYYEPFNERRWFDSAARGERVDNTHRGVDDYWHEYNGLDALGRYYREAWIRRGLFMPANAVNLDMQAYIDNLIDRAPGRPVLQFNRLDFRLPWIRRAYPRAQVIHLFRHPRDQWLSTLVDPAAFPANAAPDSYAPHDHFYLLMWANDLKVQFPFLDPRTVGHPYRLFYYIWKLSYLFGQQWAHTSIAFEQLVADVAMQLKEVFDTVSLGSSEYEIEQLQSLISPPTMGKWQKYADDAWFKAHEQVCEARLEAYFAGLVRR